MAHPFEQLKRNGDLNIWETECFVPVFEEMGKLTICSESGLNDEFRERFDAFMGARNELRLAVARALVHHYRKIAPEYRAMGGSKYGRSVPEVNSWRELRPLLQPPYVVYLDDHREEEVGLLCECLWEPEHGIGVRLCGAEVLEVGFQDICL